MVTVSERAVSTCELVVKVSELVVQVGKLVIRPILTSDEHVQTCAENRLLRIEPPVPASAVTALQARGVVSQMAAVLSCWKAVRGLAP